MNTDPFDDTFPLQSCQGWESFDFLELPDTDAVHAADSPPIPASAEPDYSTLRSVDEDAPSERPQLFFHEATEPVLLALLKACFLTLAHRRSLKHSCPQTLSPPSSKMGIQSSMSTRSPVPNQRRNADGMSSHGIWHIRNLRKHQQSHKDTVNFEELQGIAKRCRGAPEDSEREEMHWLGRLQGSDCRIERSRSSSSSDDSNSVSQNQELDLTESFWCLES
jgi:hypothetical protein